MTDKERLEGAKTLEEAMKYQCRDDGHWRIDVDYGTFKFLREQAERVQELEESCNIGNCLSKFTNKTETDNKRYQEALEKIKDNSSCVVAFGYAVKALEE